MTTLPDFFMAQIVKDYLSTNESIAAGVPALASLPRALMDDGAEIERPSLIIAAKEEPKESGGPKRVITVTPILATWLKSAADDAPPNANKTTREEASAWLKAIDDRMRDTLSFTTFLASLPAERLEDWTFLSLPRYGGAAVPMRMQGTGEVNYATTIKFNLVVAPTI